jgi:hypothetical protein
MALEDSRSEQTEPQIANKTPQLDLRSIWAGEFSGATGEAKAAGLHLPEVSLLHHGDKQSNSLTPAKETESALENKASEHLTIARDKFYEMAHGGRESNDVKAAQISSEQLLQYLKSPEFRSWVAAEKAAGKEVFWPTDVDKTMSSGDVFTYFFKWRADNQKFSPEQLDTISKTIKRLDPDARSTTPEDAIKLWQSKEKGGDGIKLLDFWSEIYWPSQKGMSMAEKIAETQEFARTFQDKIYPLVPEINKAIEDAGAHVVILSNGDRELAKAIAPEFGIKPDDVVAAKSVVGADGMLTGKQGSLEILDSKWQDLPQPGKAINFHNWLDTNKGRFGMDRLDESKVVIAGFNGDSAAADGGMMILSPQKGIGDFMVDTPGEPARIAKFYELADKYGWMKGEFVTLHRRPSAFDLSNFKW